MGLPMEYTCYPIGSLAYISYESYVPLDIYRTSYRFLWYVPSRAISYGISRWTSTWDSPRVRVRPMGSPTGFHWTSFRILSDTPWDGPSDRTMGSPIGPVTSHIKSHGKSHGILWDVEWNGATSHGTCCWIPCTFSWVFPWEVIRSMGRPMGKSHRKHDAPHGYPWEVAWVQHVGSPVGPVVSHEKLHEKLDTRYISWEAQCRRPVGSHGKPCGYRTTVHSRGQVPLPWGFPMGRRMGCCVGDVKSIGRPMGSTMHPR